MSMHDLSLKLWETFGQNLHNGEPSPDVWDKMASLVERVPTFYVEEDAGTVTLSADPLFTRSVVLHLDPPDFQALITVLASAGIKIVRRD